jgi:sigma-B regulation protein RsbU (phosphoserine phosphatase)
MPAGLRTLRLHATTGDLSRLAAWTADVMVELGAAERDRFRVDLALTEAVTNILSYTLAGQPAAEISVEAMASDGMLRVTVSDGGPAFDPLQAPEKILPTRLEDASPGGLGLVLIRSYTDELSYARNDGRNDLTLVFHLAARPLAMDVALCRTHPLLQEIPRGALEDILGLCRLQELIHGEVLLEADAPNHQLYFLLRGRLRVHLRDNNNKDNLLIEPGELAGEMSVIEGRNVFARVTAETDSTVLAMPETVFQEHYCSRPRLIPPLLRSLIARMRRTNAVLQEEFERRMRYQMLQRELESAARIQTSILPVASPLLESPLVDVHYSFKPARTVGGDFYDVFALNRHLVAFAIGDVSGKGLPAALFMVRAVTLLRMAVHRHRDPARILPELNRQLCQGNEEFMFVTLAIVLLDTDTGVATYLNAGHNPVLVASRTGPFAEWNPPAGTLLGVNEGSVFVPAVRTLAPGDTILLYTDGITEAENATAGMFGLGRLLAALAQPEARDTTAQLIAGLEAALEKFVDHAPQSDDITALALTYRGPLLPDGSHWRGRLTRQPFAG